MIKHVVAFNLRPEMTEAGARELYGRAKEMLARVPGVRNFSVGPAINEGSPYRYGLVMEFDSPAALKAYLDHPQHVKFVEEQFRPAVAERLILDFEPVE
ncbi:MAG: Dabb family protein [Deltaproteobacteria bacterium]|nr:Dabb family protein [Deltaproteobacteria bacterium]MBI3077213.1 Dabb family protein [Deltaproteobacteria bacterium]